jgi:hypothetical protein
MAPAMMETSMEESMNENMEGSPEAGFAPAAPQPTRGRPFAKGRSGNPLGRPRGSLNKMTLAAARYLAGESEELIKQAVELALTGDPVALRLCVERVLPRCRERSVKFALPPIASAADIAAAMGAVTRAVAGGEITPSEGATIATTVNTFVHTIETSDFDRRLTLLEQQKRADAQAGYGAKW